jgi:hypothetical protein
MFYLALSQTAKKTSFATEKRVFSIAKPQKNGICDSQQ